MALTPKDTETFYREVDEELRRDQLGGFFSRYGIALAVALVILLAAVGGLLWWQNYRLSQAEEQAETMTAILEDIDSGRTKDLDARLDALAKDGNRAYRAAALLTKGDLALRANQDAAAIQAFRQLAEDESLSQPYRDLALVRQTALEFDTLPPATAIARMKPLAVSGKPWFGSAGELLAIAYLKQKKPDLAAPIFAAMARDEKVPRSIKARSKEMAASLGIDVVEQAVAPGAAMKEANR